MAWFNSIFSKKTLQNIQKKFSSSYFSPSGTYSTDSPNTLAREGYVLNSSVNASISTIINAIVQMRLFVTQKGDEEENPVDNKLSKLLNNPDGNQGQVAWLTEYFGYYLLFGNSFIYKNTLEHGLNAGQAFSLKVLSERQIEVITKETIFGKSLDKYLFKSNRDFTIDEKDVLHGKTFNPENQALGLSPLMACGLSVDLDNEVKRWNVKLLQNGVNPSGIYTVDGELTEPQYKRMKNQMDENGGPENAGKEKLLEGGLSWTQTGINPKDTDFTKGQATSKREIASVYNIAPQLIGDTASQTFANYEQAVLSLHNDTAYPLLEGLVSMLNNWLVPAFGDDLIIKIDDSNVEALQRQKQERWASIDASNELTEDEKRNEKGFDDLDDEALGSSIIVGASSTLDSLVNPPVTAPSPSFMAQDDKPEEEGDKEADIETEEKTIKFSKKDFLEIQHKAMNEAEDDGIKVSHKIIADYFDNQFKEIAKNLKDAATTGDIMPSVVAVVQQTTDDLVNVYNDIYKDVSFDFALKARFEGKSKINNRMERKEDLPSEFLILANYKEEFASFVDSYFVEIALGELIVNVDQTTIKMVDKTVTSGVKAGKSIFEITKDIQAQYKGEMTTWRAERIARTETLRGMSYAQHEAQVKISPLAKQVWIDAEDNRVRKGTRKNPYNHRTVDIANGKIGLNDTFKVSGQQMSFPRDTSHGASAGNVINCRCTVGYIDEEFEEFFLDD